MKTKKQLEKEIERIELLRKKNVIQEITNEEYKELINLLPLESKEATLTQTNEIIKLIEELKEVLMDRNDVMHDQTGVSMDLSELQELLTKIKGDGE